VRFIGVSNFDVDELEEAESALRNTTIVSNQVLYNLNDRGIEDDLLPYCEKNGITVMAYTPLDDGNLAGSTRFLSSSKMKVLDDIAKQTGKTPAQVSLNWCTSRENVIAIPKSNSVERTIENCGASGWRLSEEQINRLDEAFS
jgi:diketogulonate reductase-like aldo/keto reductase